MSDIKSDYYFIVNPRAGSGKTMYKWLPVEKRLEMLGISFVTEMTDHKRHAMELAWNAAGHGYRRIIAVGGDGSLHEVYNGVCKWCFAHGVPTEEFYIGVIPIGSGNDWIKSLGVSNDVDEALDAVLSGGYLLMDVIRMKCDGGKSLYMTNVGGVGFDSHVCQMVNCQKESGKRGRYIYLNALYHTIMNLHRINVSCYADDELVFSGRCYSVAFGNGKYSGGGMRQVPLADMNDGLIDYMIVPEISLMDILKQVPRLFNGTLHKSDKVVCGQCKSFKMMPLDKDSADVIELDGELVGRIPANFEYTGQKIRVMKKADTCYRK